MAGTIKRMTVASGLGISAHPSINIKAASGTRLFAGQPIGTVTYGGTVGRGSLYIAGYAVEAGPIANPGNIIGLCEDTMAAATSDSNTYVRVVPALPNIIFEGSIDDGNGAGACQDTQIMQTFGITRQSGSVGSNWFVDINKAYQASPAVRVLELVDPAGTLAGRVRFIFLPTVSQFGSGA